MLQPLKEFKMSESGNTYHGPKRVFSGIQPTGNVHLGNYLGAIKRFVAMQHEYECLYCVVDMHAITVWQDPKDLSRHIRELTAMYMAAGLDPEKNILFNQSKVAAHAELAWIFNCVARLGWLNRMTQFKDKAGKNRENSSLGLYAYPSLMAADILLYRATHVPVGEDQKQHVELARDIAQKFNHDYGKTQQGSESFFPLPEPLVDSNAARIRSLRDGSKKMSKSEVSDMTRINLKDDDDTIAKKIKKARTDAEPLPGALEGLEGRPEADNLVEIFAALASRTKEDVLVEFEGQGFGAFKPALADLAVSELGPIRNRFDELMSDITQIDKVLDAGAERARAICDPIMKDVRKLVGFV
jgi:tryptophanyl-tRNA synthetase